MVNCNNLPSLRQEIIISIMPNSVLPLVKPTARTRITEAIAAEFIENLKDMF